MTPINPRARPDGAAEALTAREQAELRAVADGLILHDEASVRRRKRLNDAGLIAYVGWTLTHDGEDALNAKWNSRAAAG